jgi:two-component system chemotaxis sensor kinase CheA
MPACRSAELEEIWALFAQEGGENLSAAETALLSLEQNPGNRAAIATLFRALHSFKGAARMMGLAIVESLAHHAEDLIALARDDGIVLQRGMIDALFAVVDRLRALLDYVLTYGRDAESNQTQDLVETCQQMVARAPKPASLQSKRPRQRPPPNPQRLYPTPKHPNLIVLKRSPHAIANPFANRISVPASLVKF